jgi:diaminopimelate epimerase
MMPTVRLVKANAYGNDFLLAPDDGSVTDPPAFTRAVCARHLGVGADGLILYTMGDRHATMRLWNADGSASELSGNGLRCLAAQVARAQDLRAGDVVTVDTDAGVKTLNLVSRHGARFTFRAAMGQPEDLRETDLVAAGETVRASVLRMGNPQCIVLGALPALERFNRLGPALSTHAAFPAGTNVEFVQVEAPDRVRILIWERGVGPTTSSGTGSSASAVAAAAHGGADRELDVVAPGGTQRVEWTAEGVFLTGWAHVVLDGVWAGGQGEESAPDAHVP